MTDNELYTCFKAGDRECFGQIYERYYKPFYNTAVYKFKYDYDDAKDLVHDFFIVLLEDKFAKYDSTKSSLSSYFNSILNNFIIDEIRKKRNQFIDVTDVDIPEVESDVNIKQKIEDSLDTLCSSDRILIDGYLTDRNFQNIVSDLEEVGYTLNLSRATFYREIKRIKEILQLQFDSYDY